MDTPGINADVVRRAEEEFSTWKREYIVSENLFIFPRLEVLLEKFRGRGRRVTFDALDSLITEILIGEDSEEDMPEWVTSDMEPTKLLEILYRLEIIGVEKSNVVASVGKIWDGYDFVFARPRARPEQSASFLSTLVCGRRWSWCNLERGANRLRTPDLKSAASGTSGSPSPGRSRASLQHSSGGTCADAASIRATECPPIRVGHPCPTPRTGSTSSARPQERGDRTLTIDEVKPSPDCVPNIGRWPAGSMKY